MHQKDKFYLIFFIILILLLIIINLPVDEQEIPPMYKLCHERIHKTTLPWGEGVIYLCGERSFTCNETECQFIIME